MSHQSVSSLTTWNNSLSQLWIHSSLPNKSSNSYWSYSYLCWPDDEPVTTSYRHSAFPKIFTTSIEQMDQSANCWLPLYPDSHILLPHFPWLPSNSNPASFTSQETLMVLTVKKEETWFKFLLLLPPALLFFFSRHQPLLFLYHGIPIFILSFI